MFLDRTTRYDFSDPEISTWVSVQLFAKTVWRGDESNQHIMGTVQSAHPYSLGEDVVEHIFVPYAPIERRVSNPTAP